MWKEVEPEKETEIIEKIAKLIVDSDMEAPALLFLESFTPFYYVGGQLARVFLGAYLPEAGGYVSFFENKENVRKLIKRIEELAEEKKKKEREKRKKKESLWDRFIKSLKRR